MYNTLQILIPFFIAGFGTCFSGVFLDHVQYWLVFQKVEELFIVLPAILGLKGNLQMTLASRFSTHSHLKRIETKREFLILAFTNIALNQCFSIIISVIAAILSIIIQANFIPTHALLVIATSLLTSSLTSLILDVLMIMIVRASALYNINPDNVATPLASSLGDLLALMLCALLAKAFFEIRQTNQFYYICAAVILLYIAVIPFFINITSESPHTMQVLQEGAHWYPLLIAMVISTMSGIILKSAVNRYADIALFTPVINGVGGNLVAVQASRLSSLLHQTTDIGTLPNNQSVLFNPLYLISSDKIGYATTRLLIVIVMPAHIIFFYFCLFVNPKYDQPSKEFVIFYLCGAEIQVVSLLYIAHVLTYTLWILKVDPDNATIPYLTSISDVSGSALVTFICLACVPIKKTT